MGTVPLSSFAYDESTPMIARSIGEGRLCEKSMPFGLFVFL